VNAYTQLESIFETLAYLEHTNAIMGWDEAVMMPTGGGQARAKALATLRTVMHDRIADPNVGKLIHKAKQESLEGPWQIANLQWMEKRHLNTTCLPVDLVHKITHAAILSQQAWRTLRAENNWHDFAPLLEKTVQLIKESARIRADAFNLSPYDVLLDDFNPGIRQAYIDPIFDALKTTLPDLIQKTIQAQQQHPLLMPQGPFSAEKQKRLGMDLMRAIGFDFNHGRLDESHHPFCSGDPEDVRITTRYNEQAFTESVMAICHETGHARYEQGLPKPWLRQPVGRAHSMTVHESQSLLIEMQACRSHEFMHFLSPLIKTFFGDQEAFDPNNLHALYIKVEPSLIRVDADELTYPLHVILRYDIEKALIGGDITVNDLPDVWNQAMENYLGLSTKDDYKDGVLQDVHWPSGAFGYFPAYTLGALTAAQLFAAAKKAHPDIPDQLKQGNFTHLYDWLAPNVHTKASLVDYNQLMLEATGEHLNPRYFLDHLKKRYG